MRASRCTTSVRKTSPISPRTNIVALDARKIVNGQEEEKGVLGCRLAASGAQFTCTMPNGVWRFTIRGDSLAGELRLPDNTKYRDISTARVGNLR